MSENDQQWHDRTSAESEEREQRARATHTPGPWQVDKYGGDWQVFTGPTLIADLIKNEPNARLIAAAPEMLEALREAQEWIDYPEGIERHNHVVSVVDAAIKKATE